MELRTDGWLLFCVGAGVSDLYRHSPAEPSRGRRGLFMCTYLPGVDAHFIGGGGSAVNMKSQSLGLLHHPGSGSIGSRYTPSYRGTDSMRRSMNLSHAGPVRTARGRHTAGVENI